MQVFTKMPLIESLEPAEKTEAPSSAIRFNVALTDGTKYRHLPRGEMLKLVERLPMKGLFQPLP